MFNGIFKTIYNKPTPQYPNILEVLNNKYNTSKRIISRYKKKDDQIVKIPKYIFQTWHSKPLPNKMQECVDKLINDNPDFEHFLYDDDECREFIKKHFEPRILYAYDKLIPGAFKADLWRYCVLYVNGGIYIDIKYNCINNFKLNELILSEHWVLDIKPHLIYNAFIVSHPYNPILLSCIKQICINCCTNFYGTSCLHPTGPGLLGYKILNYNKPENIDMKHVLDGDDKYIYYNNKPVLKMYNEYKDEHFKFKKIPHYSLLWNNKTIYVKK